MNTIGFNIIQLIFLVLSTASFSISAAQIKHISLDNENAPNEPAIVISNAQKIYAAANVNRFYSIDLSSSEFQAVKKQTATSRLGVYGDPVLHFLDTTLFYTHLSKTPQKAYGDWFDRIVVQKISNPEKWEEKSYSVGYNDGKMQDKPWVSSDTISDYKRSFYVTWTEFDKYDSDNPEDRSRIRFSKYTLQSDSFTEAITISDTTGDCLDGDNTLEGATTAIGANGEIHAVWAGYENIYWDCSKDGGITWQKDRIIAKQPGGWDIAMPNIMRANGMPFIVSDTKRNRLYVCWSDQHEGQADVWLKYSSNGGMTWSERIRINQNKTDRHCYFPNISIDQNTGKVYIAYYDQQHSSQKKFYDIYLSVLDPPVSENPKITRVTKQSIPLPGPNVFYGDYLDLDLSNKKLAVVYTTYYNRTTAIELAHASTDNFALESSQIEPYSFTVDDYSTKDSMYAYLNVQQLGKLKYKSKSGVKSEKSTTRIRRNIKANELNTDILIDSLSNVYPLKYKLKIKEINGKRYIKSEKKIGRIRFPGTPAF